MYKSELDFKQALLRVLRGHGLECFCIETGRTTQGIPDVFVMGKGGDVWIELKNEPTQHFNSHHLLKVDWREGQQAWMMRYFIAHACKKCCLTIIALADSFIVITMTNNVLFESNMVPKAVCLEAKTLSEVASMVELCLKTNK